ncbi:uncharacterized protein K489DRAFT_383391 [Dissoconium aciculare CBS 342.82]|uniref:Uncharacterized protein n=1 Tax=Dissoconium aciculare CBS 342.82 TaxID=1314786 RepID=A0A6J3LVP2_9PEZI|nr:uncharacterized protein K489DRAFT_383391 [Dissoconium aciculare CBS 342.82]KAF1819826.1 hypothetical protein K489DRAFT_383391 [Dissoconium aciculare CBS 342.82]
MIINLVISQFYLLSRAATDVTRSQGGHSHMRARRSKPEVVSSKQHRHHQHP